MTSEIEYDSVEKLGGKRKETIPALPPYQLGKKRIIPFKWVCRILCVSSALCWREQLSEWGSIGKKAAKIELLSSLKAD